MMSGNRGRWPEKGETENRLGIRTQYVKGFGFADQKALNLVAAQTLQSMPLSLELNAFHDGLDAKFLNQIDRASNHSGGSLLSARSRMRD